jgi:pimeloyl-ACP methyl ester carboxylesterase
VNAPGAVVTQPLWIEGGSGALFAWVSRPTVPLARGGVVLVPTVGFEARCARQAMRALATHLARGGYVVLRFDYASTGDSDGTFAAAAPDPQWLADVATCVAYLRESGVGVVSAVGMRLGATIAAVAADRHDLGLASLVLWDPCESGRGFLRELRALEALRRKEYTDGDGGSIETAEFLFPGDMVTSLRSITLTHTDVRAIAHRTLVITRGQRPLSPPVRAHLELGKVDFETTDEQEGVLGVHPFFVSIPDRTITRITEWIGQSGDDDVATPVFEDRSTHLVVTPDHRTVVERAVRLGERQLFAIITEPDARPRGPWIVMFAGVHEDHTGPARMWVELSRRWAAAGLRCVRVDVSGMGESPRPANEPPVEFFDPAWVRDALTLGPALDPHDPTNVVYLGMCSGGFLAVESALNTHARGLCVVNPTIGISFVHAITRLENSGSSRARAVARPLKRLLNTHHWIGALLWQLTSPFLPRRWSVDVMRRIVDNGTDVYVLGSVDDLSPYPRVPVLRSIEGRRVGHVKPYPFTLVPELDHDLAFAAGRERVSALLDDHVLATYAGPDDQPAISEET